jgi:DNA polymerase elongation subunit (family B)
MSAIVNAYIDGDDEHIVLVQRDEAGARITHRVLADYAIYFRNGEVPGDWLRKWRRDPSCRGYRAEGEWLRTRWRGWNARRFILSIAHEEGIETFEGDCNPVKRWMADHPDVTIQAPRRAYVDIETDSRVGPKQAREEGARILTWCVMGEDGSYEVGVLEEDTDAAERVLLRAFYQAMMPYDQMVAWNGDEFDFPIIGKRTKERRLGGGIPRLWLKMDHMVLYERMNLQVAESGDEKQSYALNAVGHAQLGIGKQDFDARKTFQAWDAGGDSLDALVDYMVMDTNLMRGIEAKTGYLKLHQTVAEICGLFPDSWALLPTAQMDAFLLRLGRRRGVHFPTTTRAEKTYDENKYRGSYNKDPPERAGILRNVHVVDFSSMYPSIMVSWNMSYETKVPGPVNGPVPAGMCRTPKTGVCFTTSHTGIIPEALEFFLAKRKEMSARRANCAPGTPEAHDAERWTNGYKVVPNSFYGAQGNAGCRFHRREVAESVSQTGAWLAEKTEWALRERYPGCSVIYVDTDGLWMVGITRDDIEEAVRWLNESFYPKLLADCGCKKNIVKLAYEKEFELLVFIKAKNYVGKFRHYKGKAAVAGSKPEIKGIAYKRGDHTQLTRDFQAEIIDLLMGGMGASKTPGPTEDLALYEEAVGRWRTRILEEPLSIEQIQTVKGLSKCVCFDEKCRAGEHYSTRKSTKGKTVESPPHVRIGRVLKARGEDIGPGSRIAYYVSDGARKPQGVEPACDYTGKCDRNHLWGEVVWPPTQRLLESAFPQHDWRPFNAPKREKVAVDRTEPLPTLPKKPPRRMPESPSGTLFH